MSSSTPSEASPDRRLAGQVVRARALARTLALSRSVVCGNSPQLDPVSHCAPRLARRFCCVWIGSDTPLYD
jgi:hypothetical protein